MNDHTAPKTWGPNASRDLTSHRLIQLGLVLFLAGLVTGFLIPVMENPRVGLSSHLEGVMNGLFLLVLGLLWPRFGLAGWKNRAAATLAVFGTFANWIATLLAGLWGTGAMMPLAAPGRAGTGLQEAIVSVLLLGLSFAMLAICVVALWSLGKPRPAER